MSSLRLCIVLKVRLPNTPYCRPYLTLPYTQLGGICTYPSHIHVLSSYGAIVNPNKPHATDGKQTTFQTSLQFSSNTQVHTTDLTIRNNLHSDNAVRNSIVWGNTNWSLLPMATPQTDIGKHDYISPDYHTR